MTMEEKRYITSDEAYADYWALEEEISNMNVLDSKLEIVKAQRDKIYSIAIELQDEGK